jgi:rare lipoprotein A
MKSRKDSNELLIMTPVRQAHRVCLLLSLRATGVFFFLFLSFAYAATNKTIGTASWYSVESCRQEGTSGIMANGEVFDDTKLICASWDYPFRTKLKVINLANGKSVIVEVKDRGPAKKLYKKGRIIDLSKRAFSEIADLKQGIIRVKIEKI